MLFPVCVGIPCAVTLVAVVVVTVVAVVFVVINVVVVAAAVVVAVVIVDKKCLFQPKINFGSGTIIFYLLLKIHVFSVPIQISLSENHKK